MEDVERRQNHDSVATLLPRLMLISCHSAFAYHFFTFAGVSFNQNSGALISLSSCCMMEGLIIFQSVGNRDALAKNSRSGQYNNSYFGAIFHRSGYEGVAEEAVEDVAAIAISAECDLALAGPAWPLLKPPPS